MRRVAAAALALSLALPVARPAGAQLVNVTANWGLTFGLDVVTARFDPTGSSHYRGTDREAYPARGWGLSLSLGAVLVKHFMMGADAGALWFSSDRTFPASGEFPPSAATTTNSLMGSFYVGLITSPLGAMSKLGRKWWLGTKVGSQNWGGERRISPCKGCDMTDAIPMVASTYIEPFVVFGGGDREGGGGFRLSFRESLSGTATIRSGASLGFFFDFLKV